MTVPRTSLKYPAPLSAAGKPLTLILESGSPVKALSLAPKRTEVEPSGGRSRADSYGMIFTDVVSRMRSGSVSFQTTCLSGVTSKATARGPLTPREQQATSVFPFGRR